MQHCYLVNKMCELNEPSSFHERQIRTENVGSRAASHITAIVFQCSIMSISVTKIHRYIIGYNELRIRTVRYIRNLLCGFVLLNDIVIDIILFTILNVSFENDIYFNPPIYFLIDMNSLFRGGEREHNIQTFNLRVKGHFYTFLLQQTMLFSGCTNKIDTSYCSTCLQRWRRLTCFCCVEELRQTSRYTPCHINSVTFTTFVMSRG